MNVVALRRKENIRDLMEGWARWRIGKRSEGLGWPRKTLTGKLLDGMPSTKCTICNGKGYVTEKDIQSIQGRLDCPMCGGEGKIKADPRGVKVNPAFIRSTVPYFASYDNPVFVRIDRIVSDFGREDEKRSLFFVIWYEYVRYGTQQTKADRMQLSERRYVQLLDAALAEIETRLDES